MSAFSSVSVQIGNSSNSTASVSLQSSPPGAPAVKFTISGSLWWTLPEAPSLTSVVTSGAASGTSSLVASASLASASSTRNSDVSSSLTGSATAAYVRTHWSVSWPNRRHWLQRGTRHSRRIWPVRWHLRQRGARPGATTSVVPPAIRTWCGRSSTVTPAFRVMRAVLVFHSMDSHPWTRHFSLVTSVTFS
ncbi:unnamed protein product [Ixodes pacificus]